MVLSKTQRVFEQDYCAKFAQIVLYIEAIFAALNYSVTSAD